MINRLYIYFYSNIFLFLLFIQATNAQSIVQGTVKEEATNVLLEGASIQIIESKKQTTSNAFGDFVFDNMGPGNYTILISYLGYETFSTNTMILSDGEEINLEVFLIPAPITLSEVNVYSPNLKTANTIKSLDIKLRPIETSQDALRLVPGLFIAQHAGGGKAEQIFLRGFDIDHGTDISISVDGIPVNMVSHAHGQGYADLHFLIPETIGSADFQKGPYNENYGDFTTAGFVNFGTLDAIKENSIKITGGQFNTKRLLALVKIFGNETQDAYIAGEYNLSDGPFKAPQDYSRMNVFGKYHAIINNQNILEISLSKFKSQWNASGQVPQRAIESGLIDRFGAIDEGEGGFTERSNLNLEFTKYLNQSTFIKQQLFYTQYDFELYSNFTFYLEDSINGDEIKQKENRYIYGYKGLIQRERDLYNINLVEAFGIQMRYDKILNNELSHTVERDITLSYLSLGNVFQNNIAAFAGESFQFNSQFSIHVGARFDFFNFAYNNLLDSIYNYSSLDTQVPSFKIHFDYKINPNTLFYLYTGTGFHSNDARVVIPQDGIQIIPKAYGADLGMQLKLSDKILIQPAIWVLYLEQEFTYVGDAAVVEPSGKTLRKGIDFTTRAELTKWLFLDLDFNFTDAKALETPEGENKIPLAPDFTSIGGISFKLQNGLNGSLRYRYMDDRSANETGSVVAEGYFVNDVLLNYTARKFEIGAEIQNLFNVDWNEAQFDTESRLLGESASVSELHFTPGVPFYGKLFFTYKF